MKLTILFIFIGILSVSANGFGQVTLHEQNALMKQIFVKFRQQTGYTFMYETEMIGERKVSVNLSNATVTEALNEVFKDQSLTYKVVEKTIVVKSKEPSLLEKIANYMSLPITINGIVVSDNGPLAGVTITIKRTGKIIMTNLKGEFSATSLEENDVLIFNNIGYEKYEFTVPVKAASIVTIRLKASTTKLDEIQVVGYGQNTSARLSTGSITKITAADIAKQPVNNVLEVLSGQVPGLMITENSGTPGSAINVKIRAATALPGINGVAGTGVAPLYIVDGVTFLSEAVYTAGGNTNGYLQPSSGNSPLNTINPGDIESIEVLKDADATAIYGSRGANGVILITTKKGKSGATKLDVNVRQGFKEVADLHRVKNMTLDQYLTVRQTAFANSKLKPAQSNAPDLTIWDQSTPVDFQKTLMGKVAHSQDASVSFSGGNTQTNFLLSGTYHNESTVIPGDYSYNRGGIHLAVEHISPNRKLTINFNTTLNLDANNNVTENLGGKAFTRAPNMPLYNADGSLYWFNLNTFSPDYENPLLYQYKNYKMKNNNLIGGIMLKYTPFQELNLKVNTSYNKLVSDAQELNYLKSMNPFDATNLPSARFQQNYTQSWVVEPQADYTKKISQGTLNVLAGATLQDNQYVQPFSLVGTNYSSDALLGSIAAAGKTTVYNFNSEYKYQSLYGRLNYNWLNKYIVNLNYRYDGSSKFGSENRTGSFGSVGAAWIFTEEPLFKQNLSWLSYGKLRSSYGITGNDQIPNYQYLDTYTSNNSYGGVAAIIPANLSNPSLKWEVNKKTEIALDLGFLKDRILLTSTWFLNRTNNPLVSQPIPSITGFTSYYANLPATIQQKGLEFTLTSQNIRTKHFNWTTSFNISFDQSKLVSFPSIANTGYINYLTVGESMSELYTFHYTGISPVTHLPTIQDANNNGTALLTETGLAANGSLGDRVAAGKTDPAFFGGLSNSFHYKNFQLDILLQGRGNSMQYNIDYYTSTAAPGYRANNMSSYIWDLFQETQGKIATRTFGYNTDGTAYNSYIKYLQSDAVLSNAAYIRLKSVSFSYLLKNEWMSHVKMSNAQIFLQGQNLLTYTKFKGYDPESPASNIPPLRTIILGIKFSL